MLWGPPSTLNWVSDIGSPPIVGVYSHRQSAADCASLVVPSRQSRNAQSRIARRVLCQRQFAATGFILVLVQKSGYLPAERRCLQQLAHGSGGIEDLPLQQRRQGVPLHDDRRPKTSQNVLFFGSKGRAAGRVLLRYMHWIVISIRDASPVIRQRDEAVLQVLKFMAFLSAGRTLDEFAALDCFRAILLRFEHAEPFRWKSPRIPTNLDS